MDWDRLRIFNEVVAAKSFTKASKALNTSQSAISRQIQLLEDDLDCKLFQRLARGIALTPQGEILHEILKQVVSQLMSAELAIAEGKHIPRGRLKVAASHAFGLYWLIPRLPLFYEKFPQVHLDLLLSDEHIDFTMRQADLAILTENVSDPHLSYSPPLKETVKFYASTSYIAKHGAPQTLEDLERHRLIAYKSNSPILAELNHLLTCERHKKEPLSPCITVNNAQEVHLLIKAGMGIGALFPYMVHDTDSIEEVCSFVTTPEICRYVASPVSLSSLQRHVVFRDFILQEWMKESSDHSTNSSPQ